MKTTKFRNMFLHRLKLPVYFLVVISFVAFIGLQSCKPYLSISTKITTPNGISSLEEITLGGIKQWIFIRGKDKNNPVLIFLHGGPGEPALGMQSSRNLDTELIKHFTVVHWDQLGAGKSYNGAIPINAMTFNRWIEDCNDLIDSLRSRFNTPKVFLVGHSGGTIVGMKIAHKFPEKIHAYVGVSQIVNYYEQQKISYNFIVEEAKKSGNTEIQNEIHAIGPPPYHIHTKELEKAEYIVKYGGFIRNDVMKEIGFILLSYLTSPEYLLLEGIKTISGKGLNFTRNSRYEEIKKINFTEEVKSLKTPVYFFQGKHDMITPTVQIEEFFNNLNAEKGKRLIIFENSAHLPILEENEKYNDLLIRLVLQECQKK